MSEPDPFAGAAVFVTAARAGSFSLAAERLGLTKSAVGKTIAKLEHQLGTKLFHRTTRLSRLTADGEAYLATCSIAFDNVVAAQHALASSNTVLTGRIHIDMPVVFGRSVILPLLIEMTKAHPALTFSLNFSDATSDILQEDVDLAIRFGELADNSQLIARHLANQSRVICASKAYLEAEGIPQTLSDLRTHKCIVGSAKGPPKAWEVIENGQIKRVTPPATHQISDGQAMVDAAMAGLGLCQLPISMVRSALKTGQLQSVLTRYEGTSVEIHAVWPRRTQLNPRVRYVVDQLLKCASGGLLS